MTRYKYLVTGPRGAKYETTTLAEAKKLTRNGGFYHTKRNVKKNPSKGSGWKIQDNGSYMMQNGPEIWMVEKDNVYSRGRKKLVWALYYHNTADSTTTRHYADYPTLKAAKAATGSIGGAGFLGRGTRNPRHRAPARVKHNKVYRDTDYFFGVGLPKGTYGLYNKDLSRWELWEKNWRGEDALIAATKAQPNGEEFRAIVYQVASNQEDGHPLALTDKQQAYIDYVAGGPAPKTSNPLPLQHGDRVEVIGGAWAGANARLIRITPRGQAHIMLLDPGTKGERHIVDPSELKSLGLPGASRNPESVVVYPGMKFRYGDYGTWVVDRAAPGVLGAWEVYSLSRGRGHAKVMFERELKRHLAQSNPEGDDNWYTSGIHGDYVTVMYEGRPYVVVNPQNVFDTEYVGSTYYPEYLFHVQLSHHAPRVLVFARRDHWDTLIEEAAGWAENNAPGVFNDEETVAEAEAEGWIEDLMYTESGYLSSAEMFISEVTEGRLIYEAVVGSAKWWEETWEELDDEQTTQIDNAMRKYV